MTDEQKALSYYRTAAQQGGTRPMPRPAFVPHVVRVTHGVRGDWPIGFALHAPPGTYECDVNQFGAVSVETPRGGMLGLKLDEFEVVEWKPNPHLEKARG